MRKNFMWVVTIKSRRVPPAEVAPTQSTKILFSLHIILYHCADHACPIYTPYKTQTGWHAAQIRLCNITIESCLTMYQQQAHDTDTRQAERHTRGDRHNESIYNRQEQKRNSHGWYRDGKGNHSGTERGQLDRGGIRRCRRPVRLARSKHQSDLHGKRRDRSQLSGLERLHNRQRRL